LAEVSVKSMKKLIRESWSAGCYRPTALSQRPLSVGASPGQIVFNRPVRDCLPIHHRAFPSPKSEIGHIT
jgi:hypothetical protein